MAEHPSSRGRLFRSLWRTNLWLVPTVCVSLAVGVFIVAQIVDRAHHAGTISLPAWLDHGGANDLRDLLGATAGAIITTLGLVLSITVLTLSIAATQFGQRMLRRYMRDRGTQVSIGIFAATFIFSLLTLMAATSHPGQREFVPWLSGWISTLLALACIATLIFFVHHIAQTIQVNYVIADISRDLHRLVHKLTPKQAHGEAPDVASTAEFHLLAPATGYIRQIEHDALVAAAAHGSVIVQFTRRPGEFVLEGSRLAAVVFDPSARDRIGIPVPLSQALVRAVRIGRVRALRQDPEFAIEQLVEIALRAMSPGINDPFTMFACADWLGDGLRTIAARSPRTLVYADPQGVVRLIVPTPSFDQLVRTGFEPLRAATSNSCAASIRLLETIQALAAHVSPEQTVELTRQAEHILEGFSAAAVTGDRRAVEAAYQHAVRALSDRTQPETAPMRVVGL
ncbi:MAG: DUF2254 domain-containing protein [Longimicrobiales bacterium]